MPSFVTFQVVKDILQKIGEIEQVKGVWLWRKGEWEGNVKVLLDSEIERNFKNLVEKCIAYIEEMELKTFGYISQYDYLLFKRIEKHFWLVIWANQDCSLSLLKMEVEVILSEQKQEKKFFKKFKLW